MMMRAFGCAIPSAVCELVDGTRVKTTFTFNMLSYHAYDCPCHAGGYASDSDDSNDDTAAGTDLQAQHAQPLGQSTKQPAGLPNG